MEHHEYAVLTPAEVERRVVAYLQGRPDATRDDWRRLGAHGMRWLYTIAVSPVEGNRANRLRAAGLATLGQLAGRSKMDALLDVLAEPDVPIMVRCGAIEGLGYANHPRALPALQAQAFHNDFRVRLYSCTALGRNGSAGARRILEDVSGRDPHSQVRRAARVEFERARARALTEPPPTLTDEYTYQPPEKIGRALTVNGPVPVLKRHA